MAVVSTAVHDIWEFSGKGKRFPPSLVLSEYKFHGTRHDMICA